MTRELRLAREGELGDKTVTYTQKELDKLQAYIALHEKEYFGMVGAYWEQAMFDGHHRLASEVASPPLLPILVEEGEQDECTYPGLPISVVAMESASHASSSGGGGYAPSWRGQRDVGIFESATYRAQRARPPQASSIQGVGSFALVQPAAVIRGSPLAPPHYAAAVSAVIAAAMPAPVEGALQCALHIVSVTIGSLSLLRV